MLSVSYLVTSNFIFCLYFVGILPGHGRMVRFESINKKNDAILKAALDFEKEDEAIGMFSVGYY